MGSPTSQEKGHMHDLITRHLPPIFLCVCILPACALTFIAVTHWHQLLKLRAISY